jgi:hypothetical protein
MRTALALGLLAFVAGCSSAVAPAHPAVREVPASAPAGCIAALAVLPPVPATAQQAARDVTVLGGRKGTTLDSLLDETAADAFSIGLDLTAGGDVSTAVAAYVADAGAVRSYCT